jgi:hypothetical protein
MLPTRLSIVLSFLPTGVVAQGSLLAPSAVDAHRLTAGISSGMVFAVRGGDTVKTGTFADEIVVRADTLIFVRGIYDRLLGQEIDTLISHVPDLMPIGYSYSSLSGPVKRNGHFSFTGTKTTGWSSDSAGTVTTINITRPAVAWSVPSLPLVLRAMNLREGDTFAIQVFHPAYSEPGTLTAAILGSEQVHGRRCWRVNVFLDSANQFGTYWIDQATRTIRRQMSPLSPSVSLLLETSREPTGPGRARQETQDPAARVPPSK